MAFMRRLPTAIGERVAYLAERKGTDRDGDSSGCPGFPRGESDPASGECFGDFFDLAALEWESGQHRWWGRCCSRCIRCRWRRWPGRRGRRMCFAGCCRFARFINTFCLPAPLKSARLGSITLAGRWCCCLAMLAKPSAMVVPVIVGALESMVAEAQLAQGGQGCGGMDAVDRPIGRNRPARPDSRIYRRLVLWAIAHIPSHRDEWAILWLTLATQNWSHSLQAPRRNRRAQKPPTRDREETPGTRAMNAQELLQEISDYCRQTGLAESTFGRRAVNDGKLASRLRNGGRITTDTLDRIRGFMDARNRTARRDRAAAAIIERHARAAAAPTPPLTPPPSSAARRRTPAARPAAQFPLLRQPAEIPAVRQHLQREMGGGEPRLRSSSPTSIRARRRCACSTPASATARC